MADVSDEPIDYKSNDPIMRLRVIHENLMEHELSGTAGNLWKVITELQARRAAEAGVVGKAGHDLPSDEEVPMVVQRLRAIANGFDMDAAEARREIAPDIHLIEDDAATVRKAASILERLYRSKA